MLLLRFGAFPTGAAASCFLQRRRGRRSAPSARSPPSAVPARHRLRQERVPPRDLPRRQLHRPQGLRPQG
ncbi:hypothetical protein ACP70R_024541 [Stipagrostis hirtigluma subsp. patula]